MDAKKLLDLLRKDFPETQKTGLLKLRSLPGDPCADLCKQASLPDALSLSSEQGWQANGLFVTLQGRAGENLLGVERPLVFICIRPDGEQCQVLLGIKLPATWQFSQSFGGPSQPLFESLHFRALLVASAALQAPLDWLRQASDTKPENAVVADKGPLLEVTQGVSLYGWDAKASDSIAVAALGNLVSPGDLKVSISMGLPKAAGASCLTADSAEVLDHLPLPCLEDPSLLRRNEACSAFNTDTRKLSYAYLGLHAFGDSGWEICPNLLTLGDVQLHFISLNPPKHNSIQSFSLGATFTLGGIPLAIKGHLPATTLTGSLAAGLPPPSLKQFIKALFNHEIDGDMTIERLEFWAMVEQSCYGAALGIKGDWRFDLGTKRELAFHRLELGMDKNAKAISGHLAGGFSIDKDNEFDISLDLAEGAGKIKGHWHNTVSPPRFNDLLRALCLPELGELPGGLQLRLSDAEFVFDSHSEALSFELDFHAVLDNPNAPDKSPQIIATLVAGRKSKNEPWGYLFALDIDLKLDLSLAKIPLVGQLIPAGSAGPNIKGLRLVAASKVLPPIPAGSKLSALGSQALDSGLSLAVDMAIGNEPAKTLMVRFGAKAKKPQAAAPAVPQVQAGPLADAGDDDSDVTPDDDGPAADRVAWIGIQRAFGPLRLQRIGFSITDSGALAVLLDAGFETRGLSVMLRGLEADIPLATSSTRAEFDLAGLAVQYRSPSLNISGALNRVGPQDKPLYSGELAVSASRFSAMALGSYTQVGGQPSFVAYAFVKVPLGGPPCFFVTGLAAGVGFNRTLRLPDVDKVGEFPLIQAVMGSSDDNQAQNSLETYMAPAADQDWFAAGVRFTSFKMLESFALLTLSFGARSEVALLGKSTLELPPASAQKMVHADLLLRACLQLEEGLLAVNAQLSSTSWVFSRDARLTGGFAFYLWFGKSQHAGDFVVTLGGYHPQFKVPSHYPQVPRLGLNWRVSNNLTIKGELYFALTPSLVMAGGLLDATWQSDGVQAWFQVQTNFLIRFKPFTYRISATVSIGVSVKVDLWLSSYTLNARVNAVLDLWGPDFGGLALVDLSVVSFTIDFGSRQRPDATRIDWEEFRTSFLPTDPDRQQSTLIAISAPAGLLGTLGQGSDAIWKVDPANLRLLVGNQVPVTQVDGALAPAPGDWNRKLGVAPMNQAKGTLKSTLTLSIQRINTKDEKDAAATGTWTSQIVQGRVPAGLWGDGGAAELKNSAMLDDALLGFDLRPVAQVAPASLTVTTDRLRAATVLGFAVKWSDCESENKTYPLKTLEQLARSLVDPPVSKVRDGILAALHRQKLTTATTLDLNETALEAPEMFFAAPVSCSLGAA